MAGPLRSERVLVVGTGPVPAAAADLAGLLGAEVIAVDAVAGDEHLGRLRDLAPLGAVDATGRLLLPGCPVVAVDPAPDVLAAWAASGAMALTGRPDGPPLGPPGELVVRVMAAGALVRMLARALGTDLDLDPLALLGERAAITGMTRRGSTSVGGACHLLAAADGWVALNLPRPSDHEAVPALVDGEASTGDWPGLVAAVAARSVTALEERAALLGMALGVWPGPEGRRARSPVRIGGRTPRTLRPRAGRRPGAGPSRRLAVPRPLVVDLTALWAGPLATGLLAEVGARVVKVEGPRRPDGARRGPSAFFDLLNAGKECVALDLGEEADRRCLQALVERADLVVDALRPRVLAHAGLDPATVCATGRTTWISITGHGRLGLGAQRVAFGDDAAVAGGCTVGDPPLFVADAVADPIGGLYAAATALAALAGERGHHIDVPLVDAAAYVRGRGPSTPVVPAPDGSGVAAPRARPPRGVTAPLGAHTSRWRRRLG